MVKKIWDDEMNHVFSVVLMVSPFPICPVFFLFFSFSCFLEKTVHGFEKTVLSGSS